MEEYDERNHHYEDVLLADYLTDWLERVRLHDLRHSTASNLLAHGFSVVEVLHWLGHSQASTTLNFYSHIDATSKTNIRDALESLLLLEEC